MSDNLEYTESDINTLVKFLGKRECKNLYHEITKHMTSYHDINNIKSFDMKTWLSQCDSTLINFLEGLCNFNIQIENKRKMAAIVRAVEKKIF